MRDVMQVVAVLFGVLVVLVVASLTASILLKTVPARQSVAIETAFRPV
jgi:hypothetical protein